MTSPTVCSICKKVTLTGLDHYLCTTEKRIQESFKVADKKLIDAIYDVPPPKYLSVPTPYVAPVDNPIYKAVMDFKPAEAPPDKIAVDPWQGFIRSV